MQNVGGFLVFCFHKGRHAWNFQNILSYPSHLHSDKYPMPQEFIRVLLSSLYPYMWEFFVILPETLR